MLFNLNFVLIIVCLISNSQASPCPEFDDSLCQPCGVLFDKDSCEVECKRCNEDSDEIDRQHRLEPKSAIIPNWSTWGDWSACSADCGFGYKSKIRRCRGDHGCEGLFYEFNSCYTKSCDQELAHWDAWTEWSSCSQADGGGVRYRTRNCKNGVIGQDDCVGIAFEEYICINVNYTEVLVEGSGDKHCFDRRFLNSYRGNKHTAWNGQTCKPWDTKISPYRPHNSPNEDLKENFCRNPGNLLRGPWCYTDDNRVRKTMCRVPICNIVGTWLNWHGWSACSTTCGEGQRSRIRQCINGYVTTGDCIGKIREIEVCSTNLCPQHPVPVRHDFRGKRSLHDCASITEPDLYRGVASTTMGGYTCQRWDSDTPHQHPYHSMELVASAGLISNYCRDLDGDSWPWCISTNPDQMWDYCQIDRCDQHLPKATDDTCYDSNDPKAYRGKVSKTVNGVTCQDWDLNFPHVHTYKFFNYPQSGLDSNYCRVPDTDHSPWCITTDPNSYWDYCDTPACSLETLEKATDPQPITCGNPAAPIKSDVSLRVVGGMNANIYSMPWIVALQDRNHYPYCGASIIDEYWILTAAHCIESTDPNAYEALLGNFRFSENEMGEKTVLFQSVIPHPQFDSQTLYYDIALLKVKTPIIFNEFVKPICLPTENDVAVGTKLLIAGWGSLGNNKYPDMLEQAYVPVVSTEYCSRVYDEVYGDNALDEGMLCAGYKEGGIDTCQGDSGGPLIDTETFKQIGIVSWGKGCAEAGYPGVYTSVAYYKEWMKSIMNNN